MGVLVNVHCEQLLGGCIAWQEQREEWVHAVKWCGVLYLYVMHIICTFCTFWSAIFIVFTFFLIFFYIMPHVCYVLYIIWYCMVGMTSECIRPFVKGIKYRMDVAQHRIKYNRSSLCAWCTSLSRPYAILYYFLSCCCCYSSPVSLLFYLCILRGW